MKKLLIFFGYIFLSLSVNAQNCNDKMHSGEGTFYGGIAGSSGGNCSLPVAINDSMHCALNNTDYDNSNACGACLEVSGARGTTLVKVVDRCPECKPGDVDLTQEAFAKVANPIDGRVPITWKFVPCPLRNKTIKVNFKSGSSKYWTAIQFRDLKYAVSKMEYRKNNRWVNVNRELFNFFIEPTGIDSPMSLRITSVLGETITINGININVGADYDTRKQFSIPANCKNSTNSSNSNDLIDTTVEEEQTIKLVGYPNPTTGMYKLSNKVKTWKVVEYLSGKILKQGKGDMVDLSEFTRGNYFILTDSKVFKVLKE